MIMTVDKFHTVVCSASMCGAQKILDSWEPFVLHAFRAWSQSWTCDMYIR